MNNNPISRRRLMQQGVQALAQQQALNDANDYSMGSSLGSIIGTALSKTSDGSYEGTDMSKMEGYNKELSDKENHLNLFGNSGASEAVKQGAADAAGQAFAAGVASSMAGQQQPNWDLSQTPLVFSGDNSLYSQGQNNIGAGVNIGNSGTGTGNIPQSFQLSNPDYWQQIDELRKKNSNYNLGWQLGTGGLNNGR